MQLGARQRAIVRAGKSNIRASRQLRARPTPFEPVVRLDDCSCTTRATGEHTRLARAARAHDCLDSARAPARPLNGLARRLEFIWGVSMSTERLDCAQPLEAIPRGPLLHIVHSFDFMQQTARRPSRAASEQTNAPTDERAAQVRLSSFCQPKDKKWASLSPLPARGRPQKAAINLNFFLL